MRSLLCFLLLSLALLAFCSPSPVRAVEEEVSTDLTEADLETADAEEEYALVEVQDDDEFEIEQAKEGGGLTSLLGALSAPPKQRLATREVDLGTETENLQYTEAPASPALKAEAPKMLAREVKAKQHGPRLALMRLPVKRSAQKEHRPVRMLAPLPPRKRAPQYRQVITKQEVVEPIVSIQPMLHQRVLTRTIMQPTMQKQPVIQRIVTQPILRREIRQQPITQQQISYQNIVQTRQVKQPAVREELKVEREQEKQQTVESLGAPYPRLTAPAKTHSE